MCIKIIKFIQGRLRTYLNLKLKLYSFDVAHINYIKRVWTCGKKITFKLFSITEINCQHNMIHLEYFT